MQNRTTISEVAAAAGVSIATASVALNNKPGVSEETRAKILEIAKQMNYVANVGARALKTSRTNNIGLIVPDIENPYYATLVRQFGMQVEKIGCHMLLGVSEDNADRETELVKVLVSTGVDGVAIAPSAYVEGAQAEYYDILSQLRIPMVYITGYLPGRPAPAVMTDLVEGEYQLVRHLLDRGCRRIFLLTARQELLYSKMRVDGCKRAFAERDIAFHEEWIYETVPRLDNGYRFVQEAWPLQPDAIITINDFMAMGVLRALQELDVRVPEDVSVAGFDDLIFGQLLGAPLTTVTQPVAEICRRVVALLSDMIATGNMLYQEHLELLPPTLQIRQTTI